MKDFKLVPKIPKFETLGSPTPNHIDIYAPQVDDEIKFNKEDLMIKEDLQMIPLDDYNETKVANLAPFSAQQASSRGFTEKSKIDDALSSVKGPPMFKRDKARKSMIKGKL